MTRMKRTLSGSVVLADRDPNKMARPQRDPKRRRVDVDLTASDEECDDLAPPTPKVPKRSEAASKSAYTSTQTPLASSAYQHMPNGYERVYPSSSAPTVSQQSRYPSSSLHTGGYTDGDRQRSEAERQFWLAEGIDDEVNEIVESTQDAAEGSENLQLYGELATRIVGVQYYKGFANPGEYILIRREPDNQWDSNAIRIDNVRAEQIGHIPRRVAEKLAGYIDRGELHFEGRLAGSVGTFDCPLSVKIYGPAAHTDAGQDLQNRMTADKLPLKALKQAERDRKQLEKDRQAADKRRQQEEKKRLAEARRAVAAAGKVKVPPASSQPEFTNLSQSSGLPGTQPVMDDILEASQRFNRREIGETAEKYGLAEEALANMPMAHKPARIRTEMLPYQRQALKWLLDHESPHPPASKGETVQLWQRHDQRPGAFTNLATNSSIQGEPTLASGGILADDMGLGKTLEMIALLVADIEKGGKGTTLVVAPLSVMSNWTSQIKRHVCRDEPLSVFIHHGPSRKAMKAADFAQYDVVITTYQTLASDYKPRGKDNGAHLKWELRSSGLYSLEWRRIILDEGHTIRNPQSKGAAAATSVQARSRWVLTGTPIINSLKDLYTLLHFIGVTGGLEQLEVFNSVLVRPLRSGDESATFLLQAIMAAFTLRRRKEMKFIDLKLPELTEYVHRIDFTEKERQRYDAFGAQAKGLLTKCEDARQHGKRIGTDYQHLLEILLRMRQCCNHWKLCGEERISNLMAQLEQQKTVALTPENIKALQSMLQVQIESQEDCVICLETLHNPMIAICGHSFGRECIAKVIETQHKCPMCRADLKDETCLVQPANECGDEDPADEHMDLTGSSSKLDALAKILTASKSSGNKTIIFSQWTKFLDIAQARLEADGYKYCRIDGTMPAAARDASLRALESDDACTIMLASLGVCAVGLNLVAASQIVLCDSWWAPAIEDQAVDRVHRLGQRKKTTVFRLVMEGSIEERTLEIQSEKRKLMMLAFREREATRGKKASSRVADIARLLG